jgi:endonuclease/exonuclease/phosphatase family metal-dependent hydrolase
VSLILDGFFDDWESLPPTYADPSGDGGASGIDFGQFHLADDERFLLLKMELGSELNLQSTPGIVLYLDTDEDAETGLPFNGLGAELVFDLGKRGGLFVWEGEQTFVTQAEIGLRAAPAVSSAVFELALEKTARPDGVHPLFPGSGIRLGLQDSVAVKSATAAGDSAPDEGELIRYGFGESPLAPPPAISLEKVDPAHLRVVSFNVLKDGLFEADRAPHFRRILTALQPDVIAFQEVYDHNGKAVRALIEEWLPVEGGWYVDQRRDMVTLSRYPLVEDWTKSTRPLDKRFLPVMVRVGERPLLLFNAHLSCCDKNQQRQKEVDSFVAFLRDAETPGERLDLPAQTPFLLVGDLNLVGEAQQLETLLRGEVVNQKQLGASFAPDWDGSPLSILNARHTHSRMAYTWREDSSSYAPGRLDYVIYADSVLEVAKGFVLFTGDLPAETLAAYGLEREDSLLASDHLPVVVDLVVEEG